MDQAGRNVADAFRAVYYHLYANGQASRAERIVEDLTLVLLAKLAAERSGRIDVYQAVLEGADPQQLVVLVGKELPRAARDSDAFHNDPRAIRYALRALRDVKLSAAPAHVIGDAFQAVMGPRVRGDRGQFFTPRTLVRGMVEAVGPRAGERVGDPAAGTAGFLVEAQRFREERGDASGALVAVDKDHDLYRLSTAMLGIVSAEEGEAHNFNSLDLAEWRARFGADESLFDVVLTNPPFGSRIGITDRAILASFELGHAWSSAGGTWRGSDEVLAAQDPQVLFLELCVRLLSRGGRLGIVLPEGLFGNKGTAYVWQWLRERGSIDGLLDCPRTTFQPGTDTKTNVLLFTKGARGGPTRIAVALHCGHDRRGRTHRPDGTPYPDDLVRLGRQYGRHDGGWQERDLTGRSYLVPRYYEDSAVLSAAERALLRGAEHAALGELVAAGLLAVRKGHEVGSEAYGTGDVPFVRTSDVANFEINADPTKAVSEEVYETYRPLQSLRAGDILVVADGRYRIGSVAMLTERNARCVVQSHLRIVSVTAERDALDPYALLYALALPSVRRRIRDLVFVQSTLGTLGPRLLELRVPLLTGPGPWSERVAEFRRVLEERDRLLGRLREVGAEGAEL